MCGGNISLFREITVTREKPLALKIKSETLSAGVNRIVLFDKTGKSLCERKIFIKPAEKDLVRITPSGIKEKYSPGEKINLSFSLTDSDSLPYPCTFSLAVRDAASQTETFDDSNILTSLLLSSEIRGFIPHAAYYFEKEDLQRHQHLDLLMMVQGWSRYSWEHLCGRLPFSSRYKVERQQNFAGTVKIFVPAPQKKKNSPTGGSYKPFPNAEVTLEMVRDSLIFESRSMTDSTGAFCFPLPFLEGEWQYFLKVKPPVQKSPKEAIGPDPRIPLNLKATPGIKAYSYYEQNKQEKDIDFLIQQNDTLYQNILLEDAVIKGRATHIPFPPVKLRVQDVYDELHEYGLANNNLSLFHIAYFSLIKNHHSPGYGNFVFTTSKGTQADKLIDGTGTGSPYFWGDSVIIHTNYEIWKQYPFSPYSYLLIVYFKPNLKLNRPSDFIPDFIVEFTENPDKYHHPFWGMRKGVFHGYTSSREYYTEDFSKKPLPGQPDYRRTLYWNPIVKTDSSGQAEILFYNNSNCEKLIINAETITKDGKIGILTTR